MSSQLIELEDGTFIEVEVGPGDVREISGGMAQRVESTFASIKPTLVKVCKPIAETWKEFQLYKEDVEISQAEVELGLSFAVEGTVYLAKSKADANLKIKLTLKPKVQ
jgi:Trypsin-co-occurring domain 1